MTPSPADIPSVSSCCSYRSLVQLLCRSCHVVRDPGNNARGKHRRKLSLRHFANEAAVSYRLGIALQLLSGYFWGLSSPRNPKQLSLPRSLPKTAKSRLIRSIHPAHLFRAIAHKERSTEQNLYPNSGSCMDTFLFSICPRPHMIRKA